MFVVVLSGGVRDLEVLFRVRFGGIEEENLRIYRLWGEFFFKV